MLLRMSSREWLLPRWISLVPILTLTIWTGYVLVAPAFKVTVIEANVSKTRQDLDSLRQAVTLHDSQEPPLTGTSFRPLVGRYLQEVPADQWGAEYMIAADIGVIFTLGADGRPGGTEENEDVLVQYKACRCEHHSDR